jgi:hypothetical protein
MTSSSMTSALISPEAIKRLTASRRRERECGEELGRDWAEQADYTELDHLDNLARRRDAVEGYDALCQVAQPDGDLADILNNMEPGRSRDYWAGFVEGALAVFEAIPKLKEH